MIKFVRPGLSLLACLFLVRAILSAEGIASDQHWILTDILYGITNLIIVPETLLYELVRLVFTGLPPHLVDLSIGGSLELCSIFNLMLITSILGIMDGLDVLRKKAITLIENLLNLVEDMIRLAVHVRHHSRTAFFAAQTRKFPMAPGVVYPETQNAFGLKPTSELPLPGNTTAPPSFRPQSTSQGMTNNCIPNYQGQMREVTVLFCDIRGYTALVEKYPPHMVIHQLNEYFSAMTQVIFQHHGRLDKYMGDGLMAFFEPTDGTLASSAVNGVRAAQAMGAALIELNQRWEKQGLPALDIGIGINSGVVFIGNIGSQMKMDFTIIGDNVNLAARLEPMNKIFKTRIIISDATYRCVKDHVKTRFLGKMPVKGKQNAVKVYQVAAHAAHSVGSRPLHPQKAG